MDSKSIHMVAASKVPMLKPEYGNSAPKTTVVKGVEKVIPPTTVEEKAQKRLEDAKSLLEAIENTNESVNTAHGVSAVSTQVSAANFINVDNLSDAIIYAFFASQPNTLQLDNEDLQQINPDDL
ncbi:hypothetical protein Tco_1135224 [Tanacetum coccineum]